MAKDDAADVQRRNTDPTIPFDGALPENMAGPYSNAELEVGDRKRSASLTEATDEATRLRPEFGRQAVQSGDAITDSDVNANPSAGLNVAEDSGQKARQERDEAQGVAGLTSTPPAGRKSPSAAKEKA
jgi:hypothetical protein